jgi:hypothetical protein
MKKKKKSPGEFVEVIDAVDCHDPCAGLQLQTSPKEQKGV